MNKEPALFCYSFTTRIHDIDAAGVMFYGRIFYHIHDAYEDFLNHHQSGIDKLLKTEIILPISHTEASFKAPVFLNEEIDIEIFLQQFKGQEFSFFYQLVDKKRIVRATAITQHICLNRISKKRQNLPDIMKNVLEA